MSPAYYDRSPETQLHQAIRSHDGPTLLELSNSAARSARGAREDASASMAASLSSNNPKYAAMYAGNSAYQNARADKLEAFAHRAAAAYEAVYDNAV